MLLLAATIPSSPGGSPLDATTAEAAEYIAGLDESWEPAVAVVANVAMTILLWFMVGLGLSFAGSRERSRFARPWRCCQECWSRHTWHSIRPKRPTPTGSSADEPSWRSPRRDRQRSQQGRAPDEVGLPMGTFALACSWLIVSTATLPRSLGWWRIISGGALGLTQLVWTHEGVIGSRRT